MASSRIAAGIRFSLTSGRTQWLARLGKRPVLSVTNDPPAFFLLDEPLPAILVEIAAVFGREAALKMVKACGGTRVFIFSQRLTRRESSESIFGPKVDIYGNGPARAPLGRRGMLERLAHNHRRAQQRRARDARSSAAVGC